MSDLAGGGVPQGDEREPLIAEDSSSSSSSSSSSASAAGAKSKAGSLAAEESEKGSGEKDPLLPSTGPDSSGDPQDPKKPSFSLSTYIKTRSSAAAVLWLLFLSLLGGGVGAGVTYLVGTFALPGLAVAGVPSLLGLTGLLVPIVLAGIVSAFVTMMALILLERYIAQRATSFALLVPLVLLSGLAVAALVVFTVATVPGALSTLSFGLGGIYGPLAAFGIPALTLSVVAMVVMGMAYRGINNKSGRSPLPSRRPSVAQLPPVLTREEWDRILKELDASQDYDNDITILLRELETYKDNVALLNLQAETLLKRGADDDHAEAHRIFSRLANDYPGNPIYVFQRNIAEVIVRYLEAEAGDHSAEACVAELMALVLIEIERSPLLEEDVVRNEALSSCVAIAKKIDPRLKVDQAPKELLQVYKGIEGHLKKVNTHNINILLRGGQFPRIKEAQQRRLAEEQAKPVRRLSQLGGPGKGQEGEEERKDAPQEDAAFLRDIERASIDRVLSDKVVPEPIDQQGEWVSFKGKEGYTDKEGRDKIYYRKMQGENQGDITFTAPDRWVHRAPPPALGEKLPEGWEYIQPADGKNYYWNAEKEESTWEKPVAQPPASPRPGAGGSK